MGIEDEVVKTGKTLGERLDNPPPSLASNLLLVCAFALCAVLYIAWGMYRDDLSDSFAEIRSVQDAYGSYIRCNELRFLSGGKTPCPY